MKKGARRDDVLLFFVYLKNRVRDCVPIFSISLFRRILILPLLLLSLV